MLLINASNRGRRGKTTRFTRSRKWARNALRCICQQKISFTASRTSNRGAFQPQQLGHPKAWHPSSIHPLWAPPWSALCFPFPEQLSMKIVLIFANNRPPTPIHDVICKNARLLHRIRGLFPPLPIRTRASHSLHISHRSLHVWVTRGCPHKSANCPLTSVAAHVTRPQFMVFSDTVDNYAHAPQLTPLTQSSITRTSLKSSSQSSTSSRKFL